MKPQERYQRKQILVVKKIQYRFAVFSILLAGGTALLTSAAVFFTVLTVLGDKLASVYPQGRLAPIVQSAYGAFFVVLALAIPVICYFAIRFSFRTVGPLPKIYGHLLLIGQGTHPGKLILRDGDHLEQLAVAINDMADNLKARNSLQDPSA